MPRGGENHAQGGKKSLRGGGENRSGGGKFSLRARRTVYFFPPLGNFSCTPLYIIYIIYYILYNILYIIIRAESWDCEFRSFCFDLILIFCHCY